MLIKCTYEEADEGINGGCLNCGEIVYGGVEPDACKYECPECGQRTVYGLAELAIMGQLTLTDGE